jgi:hypothetical protein
MELIRSICRRCAAIHLNAVLSHEASTDPSHKRPYIIVPAQRLILNWLPLQRPALSDRLSSAACGERQPFCSMWKLMMRIHCSASHTMLIHMKIASLQG